MAPAIRVDWPATGKARLPATVRVMLLVYPMRIYFDHNATTPIEPAVLDAMLPYFSADFGNAASIHTPGQRARAAVETAREQVAALFGARPQEIVFTSGGTESDNHAVFGIVRNAPGAAKHIITSQIEHEAVLNTCQALEKEGGILAGGR